MVMPSGSEHLWLTGVTTVGALTDAGIQAGVPSRVPPAPLQLGMLWSLWGAAPCEHEDTGMLILRRHSTGLVKWYGNKEMNPNHPLSPYRQ